MLKTFSATSPRIESDVLKVCDNRAMSLKTETLAAGSGADNVADIGTVMGKQTVGALDATYAARAGNTGNFTNVFAAPKVAAGSKVGVYTIAFITATRFRVEDPEGVELGEGTTGVAFANKVRFTLTAGGTAAVAGDAADITVTAADGADKVVPLNPAATDGSQVPHSISLAKAIAKDGGNDVKLLVARRLVGIDSSKLIWPSGASAPQIKAWLKQLEDSSFIIPLPSA